MTTTYWDIGRRIVEHEQAGVRRAGYGEELLKRLAADLTARYGRGFSKRNLEQMRLFYATFPIAQTLSAQSGARGIAQRPFAQLPGRSQILRVQGGADPPH